MLLKVQITQFTYVEQRLCWILVSKLDSREKGDFSSTTTFPSSLVRMPWWVALTPCLRARRDAAVAAIMASVNCI